MFKKKIVMLVAAALMTLSASSAFAALADLELIRVVYERTTGTTEQITDMGSVSSFLTGTHTIAGDAFTNINNPANLYVSYVATNKANGDIWVSNSTTVAPVAVGTPGYNVMKTGINSVYNYYNTLTADANGVKTGSQSNANSNRLKLDAAQGSLGNAINIATRTSTEASLASLVGASSGSVAQNLYYLNGNIAGSVGQIVASITTNANGSTTVTGAAPVTTPIPPAFFLMGSGLLGMFGLRRKTKVA